MQRAERHVRSYGTANVTSIGELVSALDEAGYLAVDTAESYYNEAEIGKGLELSASTKPFLTSRLDKIYKIQDLLEIVG